MFATLKKPIVGAFTACVAAFVFELLVMIAILLKEAAAAAVRLCHHISTVAHDADLFGSHFTLTSQLVQEGPEIKWDI